MRNSLLGNDYLCLLNEVIKSTPDMLRHDMALASFKQCGKLRNLESDVGRL